MKTLRIYTDGACSGNQNETNIGGWGCILEYQERKKELYGSAVNTTNNIMEMTAIIKAFEALKVGIEKFQIVEVYSDSAYVVNCFKDRWYVKWKKNNWIASNKNPVNNKELWERLLHFTERGNVKFYKVKGHVNLDHPSTNVEKHYEKFNSDNGFTISLEDFYHIIKMNNRADELCNIAMDEIR